MALIKSLETKYGYYAEYWKIIAWKYDTVTDYSTIEVALFLNKSTRKSKKVYLDVYPFQTKSDKLTKTELYTYLKTTDMLKDAIDDLED